MHALSALTLLGTASVVLFAWACTPRHTDDSTLINRFTKHRPQFDGVLQKFQADGSAIRISPQLIMTRTESIDIRHADTKAYEKAGVSRERFEAYIRELKDISVSGGILR